MADLQDGAEEAQIQDFLEVLEKHRAECERLGKYEEAELAKTRLDQLRMHEENRRREELRSQQLAERLGVEEAHMKELQEFNEIWDRKVSDFEQHAGNLQNMLATRHKQEHVSFMDKVKKETNPRTPRWSRELLNLRKIQDTLAKQKKYSEAQRTKQQADALEIKEHAQWKAKRDAKIASLEDQFLRKQALEMHGLLKRIQSGREEQKHARKTELERLLQRYHNVKTQLESQQTIIRQRAEKYPATAGFDRSTMSRPSTASLNVVEIAVHLGSFRNVDLFHQGVYRLHLRLYQETSDESNTSAIDNNNGNHYGGGNTSNSLVGGGIGGGIGGGGYPGGYAGGYAGGSSSSSGGGGGQGNVSGICPAVAVRTLPGVDPEVEENCVLPSCVTFEHHADGTFLSKAFLIRYCEEEVELNDGAIFRTEIDPDLDTPLLMEIELLYCDVTGLGGADAVLEGNFQQDQIIFKSASRRKFVLHGLGGVNCYEFVPVIFDEFHFCLTRMCVYSAVLDVRQRIRQVVLGVGNGEMSNGGKNGVGGGGVMGDGRGGMGDGRGGMGRGGGIDGGEEDGIYDDADQIARTRTLAERKILSGLVGSSSGGGGGGETDGEGEEEDDDVVIDGGNGGGGVIDGMNEDGAQGSIIKIGDDGRAVSSSGRGDGESGGNGQSGYGNASYRNRFNSSTILLQQSEALSTFRDYLARAQSLGARLVLMAEKSRLVEMREPVGAGLRAKFLEELNALEKLIIEAGTEDEGSSGREGNRGERRDRGEGSGSAGILLGPADSGGDSSTGRFSSVVSGSTRASSSSGRRDDYRNQGSGEGSGGKIVLGYQGNTAGITAGTVKAGKKSPGIKLGGAVAGGGSTSSTSPGKDTPSKDIDAVAVASFMDVEQSGRSLDVIVNNNVTHDGHDGGHDSRYDGHENDNNSQHEKTSSSSTRGRKNGGHGRNGGRRSGRKNGGRNRRNREDPGVVLQNLSAAASRRLRAMWEIFTGALTRFQSPLEAALAEEHDRLTTEHWGSLVFREERALSDQKELWQSAGNPSHHFERAALQIRASLRLRPRSRIFPARDGMRIEDTSLFSSSNPLLFEQRYCWKTDEEQEGQKDDRKDGRKGRTEGEEGTEEDDDFPLPAHLDFEKLDDFDSTASKSFNITDSTTQPDHTPTPKQISSSSSTSTLKNAQTPNTRLCDQTPKTQAHSFINPSTLLNGSANNRVPSLTLQSPRGKTAPAPPTHVVVLVHGLHGNPYDLRMVKNSITVTFPECLCFCSQANENGTEDDISEMGERLAKEVSDFIEDSVGFVGGGTAAGGGVKNGDGEDGGDDRSGSDTNDPENETGSTAKSKTNQNVPPNSQAGGSSSSSSNKPSLRLSFIGHSLGGLMIRAALPHLIDRFGDCFYTYLTFSTMHLGVMYNENRLVETGLWVLKQWRNSKCLQQLSLSDWKKSPRESFLYRLSEQPGLDKFENVVLVSSWQDQYCPFDSARLEISEDTIRRCRPNESAIGNLFVQMASNLLGKIDPTKLTRFNVNFSIPEASLDSIIGRAAHIQFLENATLMKMFVVNYAKFFE